MAKFSEQEFRNAMTAYTDFVLEVARLHQPNNEEAARAELRKLLGKLFPHGDDLLKLQKTMQEMGHLAQNMLWIIKLEAMCRIQEQAATQ